MYSLLNIRGLYKPVQPVVNISVDEVSYSELFPDIYLQNYIYCYWNLKTTKPLINPYNYRVMADGCIDIFFDLENYQGIYLMGFCDSFTEFPINNQFNYIGIRFLPGMFPSLFNIDASELNNRTEYLDLVLPELYNYMQTILSSNQNLEDIGARLNDYFIRYISQKQLYCDDRFCNALDTILAVKGMISVEKDLADRISSRHLRRLFKFYIGDTAKIFSKVVRFQNLLNINPTIDSLRIDKTFFDLGYYDQSHFIKEFKQFYGKTPTHALR